MVVSPDLESLQEKEQQATTMTDLKLAVCKLPQNRLALTDKVYVSPGNLSALQSSSHSSPTAVTVGGRHAFVASSHPAVSDENIALSALQRRLTRLEEGEATCVSPRDDLRPDHNSAMPPISSMEFATADLARVVSSTRTPPTTWRLDTDRFAGEVMSNYYGHFFEVGRQLVTKFDGWVILLTVTKMEIDGGAAATD